MSEPQTILLVDDSENDLILMHAAFKKANYDGSLQEVRNGEEAIAYLKGEGIYRNRNKFPMPTVMVLDLNMPKKDGFELMAWVRAQPVLKRLAIVILTASMRDEDVERSFDLGANSFFVKPSNLEALAAMMRCLCDWVKINHFPRLDAAGRK
jgi:CheY-like chemotaxis protein